MASIESTPTLTPVKNGKSECPLLKAPGPRRKTSQSQNRCRINRNAQKINLKFGTNSLSLVDLALPVVGNIFDLDLKEPYTSALEIAKKYGKLNTASPLKYQAYLFSLKLATSRFDTKTLRLGDIFQMTYVGKREINVCTHAFAHEVCDETRFHKLVASGVSTLRQVVDDALFTALHGSRQWGITHRSGAHRQIAFWVWRS